MFPYEGPYESSTPITHPLLRPPTPGPIFNSDGALLNRTRLGQDDSTFSSRRTSRDLTTEQLEWIRLDEVLSYDKDSCDDGEIVSYDDGAHLRSSSVSRTSSDSYPSTHPQGSFQKCVGLLAKGLTALASLAVVQKLLGPFRYLETVIARYKSNSRFYGWRMGILVGSCTSAAILVFNITVVVLLAIKTGFNGDVAVLPFTHDSATMSQLSSGIHILINALSTILLSASNYTMQVITSPSRTDIDKAHSQGVWFDIGIFSSRNLRIIPRRRLALCLIMGLTSIPLHIFYNSTSVYIASTNVWNLHVLNVTSTQWQSISNSSEYIELSNLEWQKEYQSTVIDYGDLYLAINETAWMIADNTTGYPAQTTDLTVNPDSNNTWAMSGMADGFVRRLMTNESGDRIPSRDWINMTVFNPGQNLSQSDLANDFPKYGHVAAARARKVPSRSRIQISLYFLLIVIACNAIKLATMLWVLFCERSDFLVTFGDAAASFLENPDPRTKGVCIYSKETMLLEHDLGRKKLKRADLLEDLARDTYSTWREHYRSYSLSLGRDWEIGSSFIFIVIGSSVLLCITLAVSGKINGQWGTNSTTMLVQQSTARNTLLFAWLPNIPQVALSFCYLVLNSECTSMAGAREWNQFGVHRKGLRVTNPTQAQRSTYFLQLPYKFSLPLTIFSGGLHWLLSQSLFLVRVDYINTDGTLSDSMSRFGISVSGLSFLTLCMTFYFVVVTIGLLGRRKFKARIPFAASCSLVISAACHPPKDDSEAHLKPVKWGVVKERMFDGELHCSLSSQRIERPEEGTIYR